MAEIDELLAKLAAEADGVDTSPVGEITRDGRTFAVHAAGAVELRLGAEIAEAARRTPDTTASERGPDWIRFAPRAWDGHATDRLDAWFRVAWRAAG